MRRQIISDNDLLSLILDAFADLGYEGTSVRALCRHLDVSHNLIHQRYGSKEKMWYAALDHGFRSLSADVFQLDGAESADPLESVRAQLLRLVKTAQQRPALVRIVSQEAARPGPRFDYLLETYLRPIHERAERTLSRLQEDGRVRPGPVSPGYYFMVVHGLGAMASLPALAERVGGDSEDAFTVAVEMILAGISTQPTSPT